MQRSIIIAGNWKMYKTDKETKSFIEDLSSKVPSANCSIYLAVPYTSLSAANVASKNKNIIIGAQNMHDKEEGAFTGEISGVMLQSIGAEFVLLGHSERRHVFNEDDEFINRKLFSALKYGLQPILCIGETESQRENNETEKVLEDQLKKGLKGISLEDAEKIVIAYEPVWAIGTGKTATAEIAQKAHMFIRRVISELYDKNLSLKIHILYGGSVKPDNISELIEEKDIDGALIGGASLKVESFSQIINKC